jgi:hypothetical protein
MAAMTPPGDDEELIVEGGRRARPDVSTPLPRIVVFAALAVAAVGSIVLVGVRAPSDRPRAIPSASPVASATPTPPPARVEGRGPLLLFSRPIDEDTEGLYVLDVGNRTAIGGVPFNTTYLGVMDASLPEYNGQHTGLVEALAVSRENETDLYLVRRGWSLERAPEYKMPLGIDWVIARGDGNALAAFSRGGGRVEFFVDETIGADQEHALRRVRAVDVVDHAGFVPFSWAAGTPIFGVPICFCDGTGEPVDRWALEPSGRLSKAAWMGRPFTIDHSASADGSLSAYIETRGGTCQYQDFEDTGPCVMAEFRLRIANTRTRTTRDLGRLPDYAQPFISADGTLVALHESGQTPATRIVDAATGREVWSHRSDAFVVAWIDEHVLFEETDGESDVWVLLRRRAPGSDPAFVAEEIARGSDLEFLGWLR